MNRLVGPRLVAGVIVALSTMASAQQVTCTVQYEGRVPPPQKLALNKDPDVCGVGMREFQQIKVDESGGLSDVVVYLDSDDLDFEWEHPEEGYVLNQHGCSFEPYLQVFPKDPKVQLQIVNKDPTLHNVRIVQRMGRVNATLLNLSQPKDAATKSKSLRIKPSSNIIEIKCDAHDFMQGWMFAAENPHYAIVDTAGTATLDALPVGSYDVSAWHPYLGIKTQTVEIREGQTAEILFTYTMEDRLQR